MAYFGQIVTAMVTPFDQTLEVDMQAVEGLVEHLISNGSDSIVVSGTTGEGPTLTKEEKISLFEKVWEVSNGRIQVLSNIGSNNTKESLEFAKEVENLGVADGLMVVCPYYNKPSQEGMFKHFESIAANTSLPIMLYNIPGRTGVNLLPSTVERLSKIHNIVALKEASGDLEQARKIIEAVPTDFSVYSGDDDLTLPMLELGGVGVVSVSSHVFGKEMKEMILNRDEVLNEKLSHFFGEMFFEPNPVPVKSALNNLGVNVGSVRLPLIELSGDGQRRVKKAYDNTKKHLEI